MALDGRYTLLGDRLAKGSYGEVWVAWDEQTSKVVAIKRQRSDSSTAGRELNAYHVLPNHPNVLALLHTFVALGAARKEGRTLNLVFPYHNSSLFEVWRAARGPAGTDGWAAAAGTQSSEVLGVSARTTKVLGVSARIWLTVIGPWVCLQGPGRVCKDHVCSLRPVLPQVPWPWSGCRGDGVCRDDGVSSSYAS